MSSKNVPVQRRRTKRRRRKADEEHGTRRTTGPGADASGLASLQQRVGNRAVQRLLAQPTRQDTSEPERAAIARAAEHDEGVQVPSGPDWVEAFPVSALLRDLHTSFGAQVYRFVEALEEAGAAVEVLTTRWSPEAAYLMHWAWRIAEEDYDPRRVPAREGVNIAWWHGDAHASKEAAQEMIETYGMDARQAAPPLDSPHVEGKAIDMSIAWEGVLEIKDLGGIVHLIASEPADGANRELLMVAETYGLVPAADFENWLHWSTDGR